MMLRLPRFWLAVLPPLVMGTVLRVLWLYIWPRPQIYDEVDYHNIATRLLEGHGYGVQLFPPGWPLILSYVYRITGADPMAGLWFNLLLSLVTLVLIAAIAARLADMTTAAISAWIVALMPSYLVANTLLMYEVAVQFLLVLAVWLAVRRPCTPLDSVAFAGITALLALMRPFWLILPLLLWLAAPPPRQRHPLVLMLSAQMLAVLLVLPYIVVQSRAYGDFVPLGLNGNVNFWIGNNPNATGTFMMPPYGYWITLSEYARDYAIYYIRLYPEHFLRLLPLKFYHLVGYEAYTGDWVFLQAATGNAFDPTFLAMIDRVLNIPYWIIGSTALVGLGLAVQQRHPLLWLWLLFGYNITSYLVFFGVPRFRWTLQFVLVLSAAFAVRWLIAVWQQRRPPPVAPLAIPRRMRL